MNTTSFCSSLSDEHMDSLLAKMNITVHSTTVNKKIFLKIGLSKYSQEDACTLLINEIFGERISQTLKSYYKFKILSKPEDLFENSIHQKELLCIHNLMSIIFEKSGSIYPAINIELLINEKKPLSKTKILKMLSKGCHPESRLSNWVNTSFEENFAQQMILNFESYDFGSYKVGLNTYWMGVNDITSKEWQYLDSKEPQKL
ncbi:hypothetical protein [Belliella kenyensis]|nr:hypothetical protein [Belliella kenyensis]MCH7401001.1 hypothetical protein [Belliella kenyensis]